MKKNVGSIDKTLRIVLGIALIAIGVIYDNMIISAVAAIPIGTALIGWCPLYCPLKISTCGSDKCDS